jgi:hypothetical protein
MYLCREKWEKNVAREGLAIFGSKNWGDTNFYKKELWYNYMIQGYSTYVCVNE